MGKKRSYKPKRKPHYDLYKFKKLFQKNRIITRTAFNGAVTLGYTNEEQISEVIYKLCNYHFYKSMPSERFEQRWQDVYIFKDSEKEVEIYLKIQIHEDKAIMVQFKEYKKEEEI